MSSAFEYFTGKHTIKPGRTLVVGSKCYNSKPDRRGLYPDALGLDLFAGDGVDFTHDLEYPLSEKRGKFDHIDCCSVLEHVARPWLFCENIEKVMSDGATILLSVPFVWRVHAYPGDYWRITPGALTILFPNIDWTERHFIAGDKIIKKTPSIFDGERRWLERSEVVGFGVKCATVF